MSRYVIILLLFTFSISFAAETIYTWGYGDILAHMIESVKLMFATDDFIGLFKIFVSVGLLLAILSYLSNRQVDPFYLLKFYLFTTLVWSLFFSSSITRTNVYIDDKLNPNYNKVITNVPYLYAKLLSWFSKFEYVIGNTAEKVFSIPNSLRYSESGFLSAFGLMANANSHKIIDNYLYLSINDYLIDCVFPDIIDGTKDISVLANSSNLWANFGGTSGARITKYYDNSNPSGTVLSCPDAYNAITGKLNIYITNTGFPFLSKLIGAYSSSTINSVLGIASQHYLNYAVTGQAYLQQTISINMFSEAFSNFAKVNGIDTYGLALGAAKAEETARNNMVLSGILGSKYIPVIKGILTGLLAGLFPILVLLLATPLFKRVIMGTLMIFGWLSLWHLSEVLINAIIDVKASSFLSSIAGGKVTLLNKGVIDGSILDYINMVSSFYWAIPTISFLIASGFSIYAVNSLAGQMSSKVQGATGASASEMATGSINTASNLSTGRKWNFSSFENMGNMGTIAYAFSGNWGVTEGVHQKRSGIIGDLDVGNITNIGDISKVVNSQAPRLGGMIKNSQGNIDGNIIGLTGGYWNDLRILNSNLANNKDGTVSGSVEGIANDGSKWNIHIDHGKITEATGVKDGISYHFFKDKDGHDRLDVKLGENMSLSAIKGEDGEWHIQTVTGPTSINFAEELQQSLNKEKSVIDQLTTKEGVSKGFKEGSSYTKQSMLNLNYDYLTRETDKSSDAYKYAYAKTKAIEEDVIKTLGRNAVKDYKQGERVDKAEEKKAVFEGGIRLGKDMLDFLGVYIGGKIQNAWSYKDGIYVQTSDGQMYKFEWSSQAKDMRADRFSREHNTDYSQSSAYEELAKVGINNQQHYNQAKESYYQKMAETALSKSEQIRNSINQVESQKASINDNVMRFIIEDYANRHNISFTEAFRELNQNPQKLYEEYFNNPGKLNEILSKHYGENDISTLKVATNSVKDKVENINENEITNFNYSNTPDKSDLNTSMEEVKYHQFTKENAENSAKKLQIDKSKAYKYFNENLQDFVNKNMVPPLMSFSQIEKLVKEKGLNEKQIKEELDQFKTDLANYNRVSNANFTVKDFKDGTIDNIIKATEETLKTWEQNPAFLNSETNKNIFNELSERLNTLKQLRDRYNEITMDVTLWNMYQQVEKDKQFTETLTRVEKGGLFKDPKIEHSDNTEKR